MKIIRKVKTVKDFFNYLWELPQNLLGLMVIFITKAWYSVGWKDCYFTDRIKNAVSLGTYTIAPRAEYNNICVMWHENGHRIQSKKLGWLYLFVVSIPSAARKIWNETVHRKWSLSDRERWYYTGFPESQADKYGKLKRFKGE